MTMMAQLFAVIRTRGSAWDGSRPMESQHDWAAHAAFMDALETDGFVVLGGPLDGTPDVLLIVRAESPEQIRSRLSADPWTGTDLLRIAQILAWTLRLGCLDKKGTKEKASNVRQAVPFFGESNIE